MSAFPIHDVAHCDTCARRAFRLGYRPGLPEAEKVALWGLHAPRLADPEAFSPAPEATESLSRIEESTGAIPQPTAQPIHPVALGARRSGPGTTSEEAR